jgi:run domain Beclin-1 interacting cysteine-rich containing protein
MSREELHQEGYQQLLHSLKGTVEGLLISQVSNVWNIYGGLNRLHNAMERIFKHGCRVFNHDVRFCVIDFFYKERCFTV